jgi:hypothetical protein
MASGLKLGSGQIARFKEVDHPTVYSNMLGVGATPYDIAVTFAEVERGSPEEVVGIPRVKVLLTPEQANNLVIMLRTILEQYTATNGPLRNAGRVNSEDFAAAIEKESSKAKPQ